MAKKTVFRTRNWVSILYPESAPDNWLDLLKDQFIPAFVSPLHCDDVNPDGEPKKPHYHIIIMFDGVKTEDQAQEVFNNIGAIKCQSIKSIRGQARYLCHLDNPEKFQYPIDEVISLCGADYRSVIELVCDYRQTLKEIQFYISANEITSLADLADYAVSYNESWYIAITEKYAYFLDKYIKSKTWQLKNR